MAAVLAAVAFFAVTAGAESASFTAAEYPAAVSGQAEPLSFAFEGGQKAECGVAAFGGKITGATSELKLGPGFFGCTAFGAEGSIEAGKCELAFHPGTGSGTEFSGGFDLVCPPGEAIAITGNGCEVQIEAQSGLGPVGYQNLPKEGEEPGRVEAGFEMKATSGFSYDKTQDTGSCPLSGTGVKSDGVVLGGVTLRAGNAETAKPILFKIE
jgi:hypothetical protein